MISRKTRGEVNYSYTIGGQELQEVSEVKDLGIIIDKKMTLTQHREKMVGKAKKIMGFLVRNTGHFRSQTTLMTLYYALIRSVLEYGTVIWNPSKPNIFTKTVERVQQRYLKLTYFRLFEYYPYDILEEQLLRGFEVHSLYKRYQITLLLVLHDVVSGKYGAGLLSELDFYVPQHNGRTHQTFYIRPSRTGISELSVVRRAQTLYNAVAEKRPELDIFFLRRPEFRRAAGELL